MENATNGNVINSLRNFWGVKRNRVVTIVVAVVLALIGIGSALALNSNQAVAFSGTCHIGAATTKDNRSWFTVTDFSDCEGYNFNTATFGDDGYWSGSYIKGVNTWHCLDSHDQALPENTDATFTATQTGTINGKSVFSVEISGNPPFSPTSNYQRVGHGVVYVDPPNGGVQMDKTSTCDWSLSNPNYSYEGAVYDIFSDAGCTQLTAQMTVSGGHAQTDIHALKEGTYWVRENQSVHGTNYLWNGEVGSVYVNPDTMNWVTWPSTGSGTTKDTPADDPVTIQLGKCDAQTGETGVPEGYGDFSNAHYEYKYYPTIFTKLSDAPSSYERHWVLKTDETGHVTMTDGDKLKVSGDEFYRNEWSQVICPIGTYVITEVSAPEGYEVSDIVYIETVVSDSSKSYGATSKAYYGEECDTWIENSSGVMEKVHHSAGDEITLGTSEIILDPQTGNPTLKAKEQVKKADFRFDKQTDIEGKSPERLTKIPFKVTSTTTNEWHVVVTDLSAEVNSNSSLAQHTNDTNYFDCLLNEDGSIPSGGIDESVINNYYSSGDKHAGTWFCFDITKGDYKRGMTTAPIEDNNSMGAMPFDTYIIEELPVSSNNGYLLVSQEFTLDHPDYTYDLGTLLNRLESGLSVTTEATSLDGSKYINVDTEVGINDRVSYDGLVPSCNYKLKSWVVDSTCQKRISDVVETSFTPTDAKGSEDVILSVDTTKLIGKKLVCYEELYDEDGKLVAQHKTLGDLHQAVTVKTPTVTTNLVQYGTHAKVIDGKSKNTELEDYLDYVDLTPSKEYRIEGSIIDRLTGSEIASGHTTFISSESGIGSASIYMLADTTQISDPSAAVAYEKIYQGDNLICQHCDIDDTKQTVTFTAPTCSTEFVNSSDGTKIVSRGESIGVIDRVSYDGLAEGTSYNVKTQVINKITGDVIYDNTSAQVANSDKKWDIQFNINTLSLDKQTELVAYEYIYLGEQLVASHADLSDTKQTITYIAPTCSTEFVNALDGTKLVAKGEAIGVLDKLSYNGLIEGTSYNVKTQVINKTTGQPIYDNTSIQVANSDKKWDIQFSINTLNIDKQTELVAYEYIYYNEQLIVSHADLTDTAQTVTVGDATITTDLHVKDEAKKTIPRSTDVSLTDDINYAGLASGTTYTLEGKLVNADGSDFIDSAGNKITYSGQFNVDSTNKTTMEYVLDTSNIADGTKIISFATIKIGEEEICVHKDLADAKQTVTVSLQTMEISTTARSNTSNSREFYCISDETIVDNVTYINAESGYEYTLRARLINKSTKETVQPLNAVEGQNYVEKKFLAKATGSGAEDVSIQVDTRLIQDNQLVCFEELYDHTGTLRASHEDLEDYYQTVVPKTPKIETDLYQKSDNSQSIQRYAEQTLVDKITFENLCKGKTYAAVGALMTKDADGNPTPYLNEVTGMPVTALYGWTATEETGSIDKLEYTFDSTLLPVDAELVSYVVIAQAELPMLTHAVFDDTRETVKVVTPTLKTKIYDPETEEASFVAQRDKVINDDLTWTDLPKDRVMRTYSWLVNQETGNPVTDGTITDEKALNAVSDLVSALGGEMVQEDSAEYPSRWNVKFTGPANKIDTEALAKVDFDTLSHVALTQVEIPVSDASGTNSVVSTFNYGITPAQTAVAMTVVVSEDTVVGSHTDIDDSDEAITIIRSEIGTTLTDANNNKEVEPTGPTFIVDTVEYKNLIPGKTYTLYGQVVNKSDASVVGENQIEFTAQDADGTMSMSFEIDMSQYAGCGLVAFEELQLEGDIAAEHKDINDEGQTIYVKETVASALSVAGSGSGNSTKTLDELMPYIILIALLIAICTTGIVVGYRRNKMKFSGKTNVNS